jgi:hypothetical protein
MKDVFARRAGRIAFGMVLLAGAVMLVMQAGNHPAIPKTVHAWHVIVATWTVAILVGRVVTAIASRTRRPHASNDLRVAGLAVPAVGMALLMPLTIQLPFTIFISPNLADFDGWTEMSLAFTGHVHVVFALFVLARAVALTDGKTFSITLIYVVTCCVALVPYVFPAVFVALTGLPIIPMLRHMERIVARESDETCAIPYAVVRL